MDRVFCIAISSLLHAVALAVASAQTTLAIVGATVIDGTGRQPVPHATVVVKDGRITAVGPSASVRVPPGANIIDAKGKFLLPGFIDVNVHLTPYNFANMPWSTDSAAVHDAIRGARQLARHGVTTARDSYGVLPINLAARDALARDTVGAARVLIAGNVLGWGDPWSYTNSGTPGGRPPGDSVRRRSRALVQGVGENLIGLPVDSLAALLRRYVDSGIDFLKIGVTGHTSRAPILFAPRSLDTIVAIARQRGLRVDVHASDAEALRMAALAGVDVLQHPEVVDAYRMTDDFVRDLTSRGAVCAILARNLTGATWASYREHVELGGRMWPAEMPVERMRARADSLRQAGASFGAKGPSMIAFENQRANAELLIRRGCRVAVATDDLVGEGRQMGEWALAAIEGLVELGMTPMEAIVAATRNGAFTAGLEKEAGTIEVGRQADLVLLASDPLHQISNVRKAALVVVRGRLIRN